jgi:hypothetical protein
VALPLVTLYLEELKARDRAGLCATCAHAKIVATSKASTFYLCRLSETDPSFRKYPVLPVIRCAGYVPAGVEKSRGDS